mmetsp:Transcript_81899/g.237506  ORF Transcript_81899/g.237506 Transcript_81899/m.237506 type:complete len:221 (+) Transcript_81899:774-1436(+)
MGCFQALSLSFGMAEARCGRKHELAPERVPPGHAKVGLPRQRRSAVDRHRSRHDRDDLLLGVRACGRQALGPVQKLGAEDMQRHQESISETGSGSERLHLLPRIHAWMRALGHAGGVEGDHQNSVSPRRQRRHRWSGDARWQYKTGEWRHLPGRDAHSGELAAAGVSLGGAGLRGARPIQGGATGQASGQPALGLAAGVRPELEHAGRPRGIRRAVQGVA